MVSFYELRKASKEQQDIYKRAGKGILTKAWNKSIRKSGFKQKE